MADNSDGIFGLVATPSNATIYDRLLACQYSPLTFRNCSALLYASLNSTVSYFNASFNLVLQKSIYNFNQLNQSFSAAAFTLNDLFKLPPTIQVMRCQHLQFACIVFESWPSA